MDKSPPNVSSPFIPQYTIPENCKHPLVESYIRDLQGGLCDFDTIHYHESIPLDQRYVKTMDLQGNVIPLKDKDISKSPVKYCWKLLADAPIVIGITKGLESDHEPHFHREDECYFVVDGSGMTLCNSTFMKLSKNQYFFIPGNTIHNTPILRDGLSILFWYPNDKYFENFKYFWKHNSPEYLEQFETVDKIRACMYKTTSIHH